MGLNLDVPEKCMGSYKSAQEKARVTVSRIVRGLTCLLVDIARVPLTNPRNQRGCSMAMMERIKGICLKPKTEWDVIAEEIARGVAFLCAEDAEFVTGSTLSINGGQHMY